MALIKCSECGNDISDQAKFCPKCGKVNEEKICPECGNKESRNNTFCTNCGYQFEDTPKEVTQDYTAPRKEDTQALVGMILGFCSIIAWILPLIGFPVTIVGLIFSAFGLKSTARKGMAVTGIVLGIIFLIATLTNSCLGALLSMDIY